MFQQSIINFPEIIEKMENLSKETEDIKKKQNKLIKLNNTIQ